MPHPVIKFGTDGWRGVIADDFTFANVRTAAEAIAAYIHAQEDPQKGLCIAYDTRFGLISYLWTDHMPTALRGRQALRSGVVWINTPMVRELRAPFGGLKDSGMGREGGNSSMQFYTAEKSATMPVSTVPLTRLGLG